MGFRVVDFGLCRLVYFWDALRGLTKAKMERYEFTFNIARMSVTALLNIQMAPDDRITPSQLWPDWGDQNEESEKIDPVEIVKITRSAIELLNSRKSV